MVLSFAAASLIVTKLIDTLRNAIDPAGTRVPKVVWNLAAFAVGIAVAFVWDLNLVPAANGLQDGAGTVLTGFGLGAGAGVFHEALDALSGVAKRGHAHH